MKFYQKLCKKLKELNKTELFLLPRSYQIIGKSLLIKLKPELLRHRALIGKAIMDILPYIHSVCLMKEISGKTRKPNIEVIAGCRNTQTLHREHGCSFLLDIKDFMWSKGNKAEKQRLIKLVKSGETIVDMFAGIGYFSIPIAKFTKAKKIYAIDINPKAISYLQKNVWINDVVKIEILKGDCRDFAPLLENISDRIIMGYLFDTEKFLPAALRIAKNNCIIHFHRIVKKEEIEQLKKRIKSLAEKNKCKIKFICVKKIKSYAPRIWHVVMDMRIIKSKIIKP